MERVPGWSSGVVGSSAIQQHWQVQSCAGIAGTLCPSQLSISGRMCLRESNLLARENALPGRGNVTSTRTVLPCSTCAAESRSRASPCWVSVQRCISLLCRESLLSSSTLRFLLHLRALAIAIFALANPQQLRWQLPMDLLLSMFV